MDETLQDLVLWCRAELERDLGRPVTLHQLAVRSFGRVNEGVLLGILNGRPPVELTDREAEGLALALNVSRWRVHQALLHSWPRQA